MDKTIYDLFGLVEEAPLTISYLAKKLGVSPTLLHLKSEKVPELVISRRHNHFYIGLVIGWVVQIF